MDTWTKRRPLRIKSTRSDVNTQASSCEDYENNTSSETIAKGVNRTICLNRVGRVLIAYTSSVRNHDFVLVRECAILELYDVQYTFQLYKMSRSTSLRSRKLTLIWPLWPHPLTVAPALILRHFASFLELQVSLRLP